MLLLWNPVRVSLACFFHDGKGEVENDVKLLAVTTYNNWIENQVVFITIATYW